MKKRMLLVAGLLGLASCTPGGPLGPEERGEERGFEMFSGETAALACCEEPDHYQYDMILRAVDHILAGPCNVDPEAIDPLSIGIQNFGQYSEIITGQHHTESHGTNDLDVGISDGHDGFDDFSIADSERVKMLAETIYHEVLGHHAQSLDPDDDRSHDEIREEARICT